MRRNFKKIIPWILTLLILIFAGFSYSYFKINNAERQFIEKKLKQGTVKNQDIFTKKKFIQIHTNKNTIYTNPSDYNELVYPNEYITNIYQGKQKLFTLKTVSLQTKLYYDGKKPQVSKVLVTAKDNKYVYDVYLKADKLYKNSYIYPDGNKKVFYTLTKDFMQDNYLILNAKNDKVNVYQLQEKYNGGFYDQILYNAKLVQFQQGNTFVRNYQLSYDWLCLIWMVIVILIIIIALILFLKWFLKKDLKKFLIFIGLVIIWNCGSLIITKPFFNYPLQPSVSKYDSPGYDQHSYSYLKTTRYEKGTYWGKDMTVDNRDIQSDIGAISNNWLLRRVSPFFEFFNKIFFNQLNRYSSQANWFDNLVSYDLFAPSWKILLTVLKILLVVLFFAFLIKLLRKIKFLARYKWWIIGVGALNFHFISYVSSIYWNAWLIAPLLYFGYNLMIDKKRKNIFYIFLLQVYSLTCHNEHVSYFFVIAFIPYVINFIFNQEKINFIKKNYLDVILLAATLIFAFTLAFWITGITLFSRIQYLFGVNLGSIKNAYIGIFDSLASRQSDTKMLNRFVVAWQYYTDSNNSTFTFSNLISNNNLLIQGYWKISLLHHSILFIIAQAILVWKKQYKFIALSVIIFLLPLTWILPMPEHVYKEMWWNTWMSGPSVVLSISVIIYYIWNYIKNWKLFTNKFLRNMLIITVCLAPFWTQTMFTQRINQMEDLKHSGIKINHDMREKEEWKLQSTTDIDIKSVWSDFWQWTYLIDDLEDDETAVQSMVNEVNPHEYVSHLGSQYALFKKVGSTANLYNLLSQNQEQVNVNTNAFRNSYYPNLFWTFTYRIIYFTLAISLVIYILYLFRKDNKNKFSEFSAYAILIFIMTNEYLLSYMSNSYWVLWSYLLGFVASYKLIKEDKKIYYVLIAVAVFFKFDSHFEFFPTFGLAITAPLIYVFLIDLLSKAKLNLNYLAKILTITLITVVTIFTVIGLIIWKTSWMAPIMNEELLKHPNVLKHFKITNVENLNILKRWWVFYNIDITERNLQSKFMLPTINYWWSLQTNNWLHMYAPTFTNIYWRLTLSIFNWMADILILGSAILALIKKRYKMLLQLLIAILISLCWIIIFPQHVISEPYLSNWMINITFVVAIYIYSEVFINSKLLSKIKNWLKGSKIKQWQNKILNKVKGV